MDTIQWSYEEKVRDFLRPGTRVLDMGGGEEMLLRLLNRSRPMGKAAPAWGMSPGEWLKSTGVTVYRGKPGDGQGLPLPDGGFELVLNCHQRYCLEEVCRVLCKGGFFLTQQIGGRDWERPGAPDFNLENQLPLFRQAGFRIMYRNQSYEQAGPAGEVRHRFIIIGKKK